MVPPSCSFWEPDLFDDVSSEKLADLVGLQFLYFVFFASLGDWESNVFVQLDLYNNVKYNFGGHNGRV